MFKHFSAIPNMAVKKSEIVKAVVVRTVKHVRRGDGSVVRFDDNAVILINNDKSPKGSLRLAYFI